MILLLLTLLAGSPAAADDPDALIDRGVALREQGHDADALALFERAWEISPTPRARAQMALAEQALGRWVDAEAHLVEALSHAGDPWIRSVRAVLEQSLRAVREHVGRLEVRANVDGAIVRVGSRHLATLPSEPVSLPVGELELTIEAPGWVAAQRTVQIQPGELTRETIELARAVGPQTERETAAGGSARFLAFAGAGVAAAGAVAGAIWWAGRQSELDACRAGSCANEGEVRTARDAAMAVTLVAAGLAIAGLVVGLAIEDDSALACAPLACRATF